MKQKKTVCFRINETTNDRIEQLAKGLSINKSEVLEQAIEKFGQTCDKQEESQLIKGKLEEMMNEIKIIRMYHVLDTLKRSDYSNIKDVPSLTLKFDEDGRYGNKGDYVVKIEDVDKLTEYLSKTTNYYDEALSKLIKNNAQVEKAKKQPTVVK